MIITCFYLNTNYELNKKWESGIRGIIMFIIIIFIIIVFMIIIFMIKYLYNYL
jgi:heme/copper-type cytochrome/quinol oxidase subunit 2